MWIYILYTDDVFKEIAYSLCEAIPFATKVIQKIDPERLELDAKFHNEEIYIILGLNNPIDRLPPHYIAYQLEQTGNEHSWFTPLYVEKLRNATEIWDYSLKNIQNCKRYEGLPPMKYVPIGYTKSLTSFKSRIPDRDKKYDVLFYGSACPRRDKIIQELRDAGLKVFYSTYQCWGDERMDLILDSRIVLNIHYYPNPILETTRLSFLLANVTFVISEPSGDPILDRDYSELVKFVPYENMVQTCKDYVNKPEEREQFAETAYTKFSQKLFAQSIPLNCLKGGEKKRSESNYIANAANILIKNHREAKERKALEEQASNPNKTAKGSSNVYDVLAEMTDHDSDIESNQHDTESSQHDTEHNESEMNPNQSRKLFRDAEMKITDDGAILKLSDSKYDTNHPKNSTHLQNAPKISLITPTMGRSWVIPLTMRNFYRFQYPRDKLEWIILDSEPTEKLFFNDSRIKYKIVDASIPLWEKRNMAIRESTGEIIVHLDDDDYYFPESLWTKVKLLEKYSNTAKCVGCTELGVYHLMENYSYLADTKFISEASMAYTRKFWKERPFSGNLLQYGEGCAFIKGREAQVINFPYYFNFIAITHFQNYTGTLRTNQSKEENASQYDNFFNFWDEETKMFFLELQTKAKRACQKQNNTKNKT